MPSSGKQRTADKPDMRFQPAPPGDSPNPHGRTLTPTVFHPSHPLVKNLTLAGIALALFIATMAIGNCFVSPDRAVTLRSAGHDFLAFYTAGTLIRQGRQSELYDLDTVRAIEQQVAQQNALDLGTGFGPYWNPPLLARAFAPLAAMDYRTAWWTWFAINLSCAAAAAAILTRILRSAIHSAQPTPNAVPLSASWLIPLFLVTSMPFIMALGHGQNTCISLLLLTLIAAAWRSGNGLLAGIACGLLFYKPQLAAVVAGILIISMGWRAMTGLAISGAAVLVTTLITMPGMIGLYLAKLPAIIRYMQVDHRYMWDRHVTLKAFWRLLLQGYATGEMRPLATALWALSAAAIAFGLTLAGVRIILASARRLPSIPNADRLIAATIAAMPLLMPFYFDYDLLLLAVAATLFAVDRIRSGEPDALDRWTVRTWIALFAWTFVNPAIAGRTHLNGSALILLVLTAMLIARACRHAMIDTTAGREIDPQPQRHPALAA